MSVTLEEVHVALRETIAEVRALKEQLRDLKAGASERAAMRERIAVLESMTDGHERRIHALEDADREEERRQWWERLLLPIGGLGGAGGGLVLLWQLVETLQ